MDEVALGELAVADVEDHALGERRVSVAARQEHRLVEHPAHDSVGRNDAILLAERLPARLLAVGEGLARAFAIVGMNGREPGIGTRQPLLLSDPEQLLDLGADELAGSGLEIVQVGDRRQPLDQRLVLGQGRLQLAVELGVLDRAPGHVAEQLAVRHVVLAERRRPPARSPSSRSPGHCDTSGRTKAALSPCSRSHVCSPRFSRGVTDLDAERLPVLEHPPGGRVLLEVRVDLSGRHLQAEIRDLQVGQRHQDVALAIPERDRGRRRAGLTYRPGDEVLGQSAQVEARRHAPRQLGQVLESGVGHGARARKARLSVSIGIPREIG